MRIILNITLVLILIAGLAACNQNEKTATHSSRKTESYAAAKEGDQDMNREIVKVCTIEDAEIIVQNTQEEKYRIPGTGETYEEGDYLMIHFTDDQKMADETKKADYEVKPSLVEITSTQVQRAY